MDNGSCGGRGRDIVGCWTMVIVEDVKMIDKRHGEGCCSDNVGGGKGCEGGETGDGWT